MSEQSNKPPPPAWLEAFQRSFGETIRTPLDRSTGTLRATPERYPATLARGVHAPTPEQGFARLAVYNRQYWFRLFGVLQSTSPLTARLLGYWSFNEHAAQFLHGHAPRDWDIERASEGFVTHLADVVGSEGGVYREPPRVWVEGGLLLQAARIDAAFRQVFHTPLPPGGPFRLSPDDADRLLVSRLVRAPHVALVEQDWPLLALRSTAVSDGKETCLPVPQRLDTTEHWALVRTDTGTRHIPLAPLEADLLALLATETVGAALAMLETSCPEHDRAALPQLIQRYLANSVERGLWASLETNDDKQQVPLRFHLTAGRS